MRAGSAIEKDRVARILFLNLSIDNEKRLSPIWKEPFASLVKAIEMSSGAAEASQLEPFESISDWLLSSPDIDWALQLREASRSRFVQQYQL